MRLRRTILCLILLRVVQTSPAAAQPPSEPNPMNRMDHGPFVSSTITLDPLSTRAIIAHKAVAVRVGPDAVMAFDTDLLRVAGAWTGGLLHWYDARDALQEWPTPDGYLHFTTDQRPGWTTRSFADPRVWRYGPLPDGRRYNGLYLNGDDVVFSYTVGESTILELFGYQRIRDQPIFTRTLNLTPTAETLALHVVQAPDGLSTILDRTELSATSGYVEVRSGRESRQIGYQGVPAGAEWRLQNGHLVLRLPEIAEPARVRLAIGPVRPGGNGSLMADYLAQAAPLPDLAAYQRPGPARWEALETTAVMGAGSGPFAVDELRLPRENPWGSHIRLAGVDFLSDGRAVVVSMSGDVWLVDGIAEELGTLRWQRFATGLNQPLGVRVVDDRIHVTGRDQITRLHDLDGDDHADFYENFNNQVMAATNYHGFTMNLETDSEGNFYFAKGTPWPPETQGVPAEITPHHGTIIRVSPDGRETEIVATGLRNGNGMSIGPDDEIYYADNEGHWTPTSKVTLVKEGGFHGFVPSAHLGRTPVDDDFVRPAIWIPNFIDNSPAQPRVIVNDAWPEELQGDLVVVSYGKGTLALGLMEEVEGVKQGAHLVLPLEFKSGLQHTRFHSDGHLYIVGLTNWQSTGHGGELGSFHRVRYTGQPLHLPVAVNTKAGGIELRFSEPLDPAAATDPASYGVSKWTYIWNSIYGSREGLYSVDRPGELGSDTVEVRAPRLSDDRRSVFLEIPGLEPGQAGAVVPAQDVPHHIQASLGVVVEIDLDLRAADGAPIEHVIHKTIHRVPTDPFDPTSGAP